MKMPKAMRMLSYVADYEFPEDNILTSMYQEEQRVRHAERIRQVEPVYKLEELSLGTEEHLNNAKKAQNEKDRKLCVDYENRVLLKKLELIHGQIPKQFDVSHLSEEILNAPRASNLIFRRKIQEKINCENRKLRKRLEKVKGTISSTPKKIAHEDQKHQYFLHQISKVDRRKKNRRKKKKIAKEAAAAMANLSSSIGTSIHTSTLQAQHPSPSKLPSPNKKRGASSSYPWNEDPEVITQKLPALLPTTKFKPSQTEEFFPALKNTTKYKTSTALTTTKNNNNTTENTHNTVS